MSAVRLRGAIPVRAAGASDGHAGARRQITDLTRAAPDSAAEHAGVAGVAVSPRGAEVIHEAGALTAALYAEPALAAVIGLQAAALAAEPGDAVLMIRAAAVIRALAEVRH